MCCVVFFVPWFEVRGDYCSFVDISEIVDHHCPNILFLVVQFNPKQCYVHNIGLSVNTDRYVIIHQVQL